MLMTFLYVSNEQVEYEIKNTIPFNLLLPKYLHINLTKYMQDLYEKNYTRLMNKVKEKLNNRKDIYHIHGEEDPIM